MVQPDLHYDGQITIEYLIGLRARLQTAIEEIVLFEPDIHDEFDGRHWESCLRNWVHSLGYANLRCLSVQTHVRVQGEETCPAEMNYVSNPQLEADDRKCVDITLSILRDFEEAKNKRFLNE